MYARLARCRRRCDRRPHHRRPSGRRTRRTQRSRSCRRPIVVPEPCSDPGRLRPAPFGPAPLRDRISAAAVGSILRTCRRSAPGTATGTLPKGTSNISSRLDAGSVLTRSTDLPPSTSARAAAQAIEVLPTPPLPVKNKKRVGLTKSRRMDRSIVIHNVSRFGVEVADSTSSAVNSDKRCREASQPGCRDWPASRRSDRAHYPKRALSCRSPIRSDQSMSRPHRSRASCLPSWRRATAQASHSAAASAIRLPEDLSSHPSKPAGSEITGIRS